jgi:hypothetical protein
MENIEIRHNASTHPRFLPLSPDGHTLTAFDKVKIGKDELMRRIPASKRGGGVQCGSFRRGAYDMTAEDDVSAKERVLAEYAEAQACRHLEGRSRPTRAIHALGRQLSNAPELLSINGQSLDRRYAHGSKNFSVQLPTTEAVSALCHDI